MTDTPVCDVLSELQAQESQDLIAARARYWSNVEKVADGVEQLTKKEMVTLRIDLRTLGLTTEQMQRDVETLNELRSLSADDSDPVAEAREAHAAAKKREEEANAAFAAARAALVAAEEEQRNAYWAALNANHGIHVATAKKKNRARRIDEMAGGLLVRGMPADMVPPKRSQEKPAPRIPHRVLKTTFDGEVLREPGAVAYLPERVENEALRPLAEGEAPEEKPRWRVRVLRNFRDDDGGSIKKLNAGPLRMAGDVYETTVDPTGNPFLAIVPDDVPIGLGKGESQQPEAQTEEASEVTK